MSKPIELPGEMSGVLQCPKCGGAKLRHYELTAWMRAGTEHDTMQVEVLCNPPEVKVGTEHGDNPSPHHDALTIGFFCESCPGTRVLALAQHNGFSYLWWRE